jgi:hyperosmotically inducible protein
MKSLQREIFSPRFSTLFAGSVSLLLMSTGVALAENPSPTASPGSHLSDSTTHKKNTQPKVGSDARARLDNTQVNRRDRDDRTITPVEQSNNQKSLEITSKIRQAIVGRDDFTVYGHNIKIITTEDGRVTLRGPVNSFRERDAIEKIASDVAGANRVHSQIEVVPDND